MISMAWVSFGSGVCSFTVQCTLCRRCVQHPGLSSKFHIASKYHRLVRALTLVLAVPALLNRTVRYLPSISPLPRGPRLLYTLDFKTSNRSLPGSIGAFVPVSAWHDSPQFSALFYSRLRTCTGNWFVEQIK
ncbi:hypothetical protein C8R44DRAFT_802816 [Mycena epipterygia]|nr:hypothetical protein C8R44DRAFT_802816 [Mycena epipterygia]